MNNTQPYSYFSDFDIDLFKSGKHFKLYEKLGAHPTSIEGVEGVYFAVWAPSADHVEVVGDFNFWKGSNHPLFVRWDSSGIWEGFIPEAKHGQRYKYKIHNKGQVLEKADPYARFCEHPPQTASIIWQKEYEWQDEDWMNIRGSKQALDQPYSVYEVHLGSWRKKNNGSGYLEYGEIAQQLTEYVTELGYTHVEFLPVMEHPFDPSWGYQVTGYFAPSSRFGDPEGFKHVVDSLHQAGIGVILDWVPAHFPSDEWALANFDGTHLYEHPDPRKGYHPDWKSLIFNFERNEVRSFLISSALFWLDQFHVDGLRVDAVASMLYLDYSRNHGEWEANQFGGNENLAAISFIKDFNQAVYHHFPDTHTIAEESTSFPGITKPVHLGGLGFGMKWMMGWMNDALRYFARDAIYRKYHQNEITFSLAYAFTENFMLPLSHDEVVHGKQSILYKMPGDEWQKHANVRLLYGFMFTHPGTKLLFMGNEFAQSSEWNHKQSLDWHLLQYAPHRGVQELIKDLNHLYRSYPALYCKAFDSDGFEWIDFSDHEQSVLTFVRKGEKSDKKLLVAINLTPTPRDHYKIGVDHSSKWQCTFNTDHPKYWGSDYTIKKSVKGRKGDMHGKTGHIEINLPPLSVLVYEQVD